MVKGDFGKRGVGKGERKQPYSKKLGKAFGTREEKTLSRKQRKRRK